MEDRAARVEFERIVLPHLDAAYNLARWLLHNEHDAQDATQEAFMRAFRFFDTLRDTDVRATRAWLLRIVRNICLTMITRRGAHPTGSVDMLEEIEDSDTAPEATMVRQENVNLIRHAIDELPPEFRETIVLRELEGLSYAQIAQTTDVQVGTVMSRLSRARRRLTDCLTRRASSNGGVR